MQTLVSGHENDYFSESQIFGEFLEIMLNLENISLMVFYGIVFFI